MVVHPKQPKMIIFSRANPWLLGTTILGNPPYNLMKPVIVIPKIPSLKAGYCGYLPWQKEGAFLEEYLPKKNRKQKTIHWQIWGGMI